MSGKPGVTNFSRHQPLQPFQILNKQNATTVRSMLDINFCLITGKLSMLEDSSLLYEKNTSGNPGFSYWNYEIFDLVDRLIHDECRASFTFDFYLLEEVLQIPEWIICPNSLVVSGIEGFCIFTAKTFLLSKLIRGYRSHCRTFISST